MENSLKCSIAKTSLKKSFPYDHPSKKLWRELWSVEPYPLGVVSVPEQIPGTSFFPGGSGLWCEDASEVPPLPVGGVMILGHDFHTVAGYESSRLDLAENLSSPTWRHLLSFLREAQIALDECFFTNVYMGLRTGNATTGRFPGSRDLPFVERCRVFFTRQLQAQRPRLILTLGAFVPPFLAPLSPQLSDWAIWRGFRKIDLAGLSTVAAASFTDANHICALATLTHPCFRPANVSRRRWQSFNGNSAELEMVRQVWNNGAPSDPSVTTCPAPQ